ncbi:hypothetical protein ACWJNK_19435, partial [Escherichia coli]
TSIICSPMTSLKTSIKTITYLSDIGCLEIQGASLEAKWLSASNEGDASAKIMAEKSLKSLIPGDIDRPQHKEFVGKIDEVLRNFDEKILSLDHDLVINRTAEKKNTYDALQRCGLINIDPLNKL